MHAAETPPIRRSDLVVHELDGEALIYDAKTADTHRLNGTAFFIWQCCAGRDSPTKIADQLAECYDVRPNAALNHVRRMIDELCQKGLLETDGVEALPQELANLHATMP